MIKSVLLILMFLLAINHNGLADTKTVCPDCEIQSISDAVLTSTDGDTVIVQSGLYKEGNIVINKSITLLGVDWPVIDGENDNEILTITANNVMIKGLVIQNVGTSYIKDRAGINLVKVSNCIVEGNRLNNAFFGIYLQQSTQCIVRNNIIIGKAEEEMSSGNAIHLWHCNNIKILNNEVRNHRDGIYLEFVNESLVEGNLSIDNLRYGLHFMFSNHDQYINNTFQSNGAGVAVMFSDHILMTKNKFIKNWGGSAYGLLLKEIYDGEISHNLFLENTTAIYGESATRLSIYQNEFKSNGWALKVLGSSMDNEITNNNFISNTFDLSTNSKRNYNNYDGNYWQEYNGYDLDKNGRGDVPYHPMKLFAYIVTTVDPSIILLRSLFIDLLNFAEMVTPVFTPATLVDNSPLMKPILTP